MLLTLKVLELNTFQNKWKHLLVIKKKGSAITKVIFRIQGYFCIGFIDLCLKVKDQLTLLIFIHQIIKKNDDTILNYFKNGGMQFIWNT